ncbi:putative pre-rRNA-processing protein TSR2 [Helianthus annuus]|nr:putative pre-rRNA-processing protein TSR2 [Helianthus annuus]
MAWAMWVLGGHVSLDYQQKLCAGESATVMPAQLTPEAANQLREGIGLLLGRWSALQMAIQNECGGRDTRQRAQQLTLDIYQWLIRPSEGLYVDELEDLLDDFMLSLNTEIDDGSIEEVRDFYSSIYVTYYRYFLCVDHASIYVTYYRYFLCVDHAYWECHVALLYCFIVFAGPSLESLFILTLFLQSSLMYILVLDKHI